MPSWPFSSVFGLLFGFFVGFVFSAGAYSFAGSHTTGSGPRSVAARLRNSSTYP